MQGRDFRASRRQYWRAMPAASLRAEGRRRVLLREVEKCAAPFTTQVALRAVQYSNSSDNPSTCARTVSFTVNDGTANSNTLTSTVNVAAVNDAPVLATGSTLNYTENGVATRDQHDADRSGCRQRDA